MAQVTPEVVDGLINTYAWADATLATYGPGLTAAGIAGAGWRVRCRAVDRIERRREQHGIRRLESFANHPANRSRKEKP